MPVPSDSWTAKRLFTHMERWDLSLTGTYLIFTIVLAAATARRFYGLDTYSLWSDELWGVVASSQGSWWAMIQDLIANDSHPPGYQTLLYWWMKLAGNSDFSIRLPSAIAGLLTIVATFELGRRHFSATTGLIAAAMISGAYQAIYYSQEARAYAFLMCFTPAFAIYYLDLFVTRSPERTRAALYGFWITATALLYFHYIGAVILASAAVIWLYAWLRSHCNPSDLRLAVRAFGLPCLLYLPWLPVMYHHLADAPSSWATPVANWQRIVDTYRFLLGPEDLRFYLCIVFLAILLVMPQSVLPRLAAPATASIYTNKLRAWDVLLLLSVLPVLVFVIQSHSSTSAYTFRHFTYSIPLFAVILACLPAFIARLIPTIKWRIRYVGSIYILSATINTYYNAEAGLYEHYMKEDFRGAVDILVHDQRFMNSDEKKIIVTNSPFFDHYLQRSGLATKSTFQLTDPQQIPALESMLQAGQMERFYYLEVSPIKITPMLEKLLEHYYTRCYSRLNKVNVVKFMSLPAPEDKNYLAELHDCPLKSSVRPQKAQKD